VRVRVARGARGGSACRIGDFRNQLVWLLLPNPPIWLNAVGGYIQLGVRVVVLCAATRAIDQFHTPGTPEIETSHVRFCAGDKLQ
jgi:hypothetical protein